MYTCYWCNKEFPLGTQAFILIDYRPLESRETLFADVMDLHSFECLSKLVEGLSFEEQTGGNRFDCPTV